MTKENRRNGRKQDQAELAKHEGQVRTVEGDIEALRQDAPSNTIPADQVDLHQENVKKTKERKVCITGFAESTRDIANRLGKDYEIWALNRCHTFLKRWDRWFEVHEADLYTGKTGLRESDYINIIRKSKVPVYMMHPDPQMGNVIQFPFEDICRHFGKRVNPTNEWFEYFTTSIAYMIALAIYEHEHGNPIDRLLICGVDMSAFSEYSEQHPCVTFWLGMTAGAGIPIEVPVSSPLLKSAASYGRHSERALWAMAKERIEMYQNKQQQGNANLNALAGADSEYQHVLDTLKSRVETWKQRGEHDRPDGSGKFMGVVITNGDGTKTYEELKDTPSELEGLMKHFGERRKEIGKFHAQVNADLNSSLGGFRECQHWLVAINAPQTEDQEPEPVKLLNI